MLPVQRAVFHEDGEASSNPAAANENAFGAALWNVYFSGDRVMDILGVRRRSLTNTNGAWWIFEVGNPSDVAGVQRRVGTLGETIVERQDVVLSSLCHEPVLQLAQFLRFFGGEIVGLREV